MARYTSAYSSFIQRLDEVEVLRSSAAILERKNATTNNRKIGAYCRGSVLLLSGHVEAYVKELGEIALERVVQNRVSRSKFPDRVLYHISKDIITEISDTKDPDGVAKKLLGFLDRDAIYWSKIGHFPFNIPAERFNKGFSNPAFEKVKAYLSRFGYETFRHDINFKLKANAQPVVNMLNHMVDTRNNIAHGDPLATKTPAQIREMVDLVSLFCRTTDQVFSDWCKSQYCPIRGR